MTEKYVVTKEDFAAHMADFIIDNWVVFLEFSKDFDYNERDCNEGIDLIMKSAGRSYENA